MTPVPVPVPTPGPSAADPVDVRAVTWQLGRAPRGLLAVAHRCPCGLPDVVETAPRLPDGTPFPTLYYLTCPRAASAVGRLEASGVMASMTARIMRSGSRSRTTARWHGRSQHAYSLRTIGDGARARS